MNSEKHQEIYRVAFESANSELNEITAEFERLRVRKDQIERLILALKAMFEEEEQAPSAVLAQSQPDTPSEAKAGKSEEELQPQAVGADPFQRRIDHVLGIGAGIRDVRKYSRQF